MRRLSGLRYIYEARFGAGESLVQECFAVLGIAVGVALLFASQVASTSLTRAVAQLNTQLVGSAQLQLKARGYEGVPEAVAEQVRRAPGVTSALPILERQTNLVGSRGERPVLLIGIEPNELKAAGPLLRKFSPRQLAAARAIAIPSPLAREIGTGSLQTVRLQVGASYVETLVGATLAEEDIGALEHSPIAVTSLRYARRLTGAPGRLTRIFIHYEARRSKQAVSALRNIAYRWHVNLQPSTFESRVFEVAVGPVAKSEMLFSVIAALVGFMFALDAMLITVPARRRLIADMRPHGILATVTVLLIDAGAIGIVACVLGLALGDLLSIAVFNATPGYLTYAFPIGNGRIITWSVVALAVGVGMGASVLGVLWPMRGAGNSQEHSSESVLHRKQVRRGLAVLGLFCVAVATFTLIDDARATMVGNIALVFAVLCLLPLLFDVSVAIFARLSAILDDVASGTAAEELENPQTYVRYLAIAGTAALAVFGTVEFGGVQTNLTSGLHASARGIDSSSQLWVVPAGDSSLQTTVSFDADNTRALADIPGVQGVSEYRGSFLDWGERRLWVLAPAGSIEHPIPETQVRAGVLSAATARVRAGGWAVLSESIVAEHHLHIGESFVLPSPRPTTLRLAAVTSNLGWPPGSVIMNAADYARGWSSPAPSAYQINTATGTSPVTERALVEHALRGLGAFAVETSGERERRHYAEAAQGLSRMTQIRILILVAAILAVGGAMGALLWSRREHFAALKCHGMDEGRLWRTLLCESAVILAVGCAIGAIFGLYAQLLGSHFLSSVTGFPIVFGVEGVAAVRSFVVVTVATLAVLAIPGYLVVRVPPSTVSPAF
ncbi:MAG TPA: FtsX-like permease family protein [Solirubrobacteraceae bacterium]|nr:FtsX-like permease family protein [Solirubrobacteraceae bacterium]